MASEFRGTEVFEPRRRVRRVERQESERRGRLLGVVSLLAGLLTAVLTGTGIGWAVGGQFAPATTLAYVATGTSIVAVLGGICALVLGRGRVWGLVAIVVGLAADPLLLTRLLDWASSLG